MYIKSLNYSFSSLLKIIVAVVLIYFFTRGVIYDKMMLAFIFFVLFMAFIYIKKPAWALAVLIVLGINIFGAFPLTDFPFISIGGLGSLLIHDILLLTFLGIMFLKTIRTRRISIRPSITHPLIAFILLSALEGVLSFFAGTDLHFIGQSMRPYAYYLLYFLILSSIKNGDELIQFMKLIVIIAVISAGITYYQTITGELILSINKRYLTEYNLYQSLNSALTVMICTFLSLLSLLIGKNINKYLLPTILILCWIGGAIFLILSRGIWISILLAIGIIIILNILKIRTYMVVLFLIFLFIIVVSPVIERHFSSKTFSYIITDRFHTLDHSFRDRTNIMRSRLNYLIDNPSLFGHGFKRRDYRDGPTIVTHHNLFGDLAARYGFSGFLVFGWLMFAVFRQAIRLLKSLTVSWQKSLVCGLLAFNASQIILSYSSNSYFHVCGIVMFASSWAVLELIDRFHKQEHRRSLTAAE